MPELTPTKETVLNAFIDNMLADKGERDLDAAERVKLRERLERRVEDKMLQALNEDQLAKLEELTDEDAPDAEIEQVFAESGIDFSGVAAQAMQEFREEYLDRGGAM